jgi:hypothetical protein
MNKTKIVFGTVLGFMILGLIFMEFNLKGMEKRIAYLEGEVNGTADERVLLGLKDNVSKIDGINEEVYGTKEEKILFGLTDGVSKIDNIYNEVYGVKEERAKQGITDERVSLVDLILGWIRDVSQGSQTK